jgi:CheY-like chemotaxis protein
VTPDNVSLQLRLASDAGNIRVDAAQIEQVLMNLVLNARDAMPDGGRLAIETGAVEIGEEYARTHVGASPGRYVLLAVSDTGHGMDEETKSHVFEPFYTTKHPGKGTGLGLSIVYATVTQIGGHIDVISEPGKGTTIRLFLPAALSPPEQQPRNGSVRRPLPGTETILLVEDEAGVRLLLKEVLHRSGYTVLEARDADDALHKAAAYPGPIGLLLTDVVMPRLSGADLARRIREQRRGMKVLYVSGYADELSLPRDRFEAGEAFLQKPFTPDLLLNKLRDLLDVQ